MRGRERERKREREREKEIVFVEAEGEWKIRVDCCCCNGCCLFFQLLFLRSNSLNNNWFVSTGAEWQKTFSIRERERKKISRLIFRLFVRFGDNKTNRRKYSADFFPNLGKFRLDSIPFFVFCFVLLSWPGQSKRPLGQKTRVFILFSRTVITLRRSESSLGLNVPGPFYCPKMPTGKNKGREREREGGERDCGKWHASANKIAPLVF